MTNLLMLFMVFSLLWPAPRHSRYIPRRHHRPPVWCETACGRDTIPGPETPMYEGHS